MSRACVARQVLVDSHGAEGEVTGEHIRHEGNELIGVVAGVERTAGCDRIVRAVKR
jgi:hypothetical protein